jgi:hypothetical protein
MTAGTVVHNGDSGLPILRQARAECERLQQVSAVGSGIAVFHPGVTPTGYCREVDGVGHGLNYNAPEQVAALVRGLAALQ